MIQSQMHGDILEIVIVNPPVNALGAAVCRDLAEIVAHAQDNPKVRVIVIRGQGKLFSGGADISEFDNAHVEPVLPDVLNQIEASKKPIVVALHGMALGGGLELALAAHYRVATRNAQLGVPEVKLGILPGAGGTQRLPRLIGIEQALKMIVSGDPVAASDAADMGLIDKLVDEADLATEAIAYARTLTAPRPTADCEVVADPEAYDRFAAANGRLIRGLDAPQACIEAVRASSLPFSEGLAVERALFEKLVGGNQSRALRHAFFAERAAARIDDLPKDVALRPILRVGVIGAGTMGGGISMNFLSAGIAVTIVEMKQEALDRGVGVMRANYEASASKGRLSIAQVEQAMGLLTPTLDFYALAGCDLVIEAVYENMDVKKDIFARLDAIAKPGAILASNTSFLSIDEIAGVTHRPDDVLGLHFFSPANVMKLLEVVRGAKTAPVVLATGMSIARRIGKVAVVSGVCHGFIGNRMLTPRHANADALLLEGATPQQIDLVHTRFGMPMGPFQMSDLAGLDIGWHRDPSRCENVIEALCAAGRFGQKTGAGFYDYDERRRPHPSPLVEGIIAEFREKAGNAPREISDDEIVARTLYTMVNEGAKILDEGIAQRASDIDVVWLYGYGWPRHAGGPMYWAEQVGLQAIVDGLNCYKDRMGPDFTLSPLLERSAQGDGRFKTGQKQ
jgi:3-hydroxyacyl-CoA dehydrogenase